MLDTKMGGCYFECGKLNFLSKGIANMREVAKVKKKYWFQYFLVFITLSFALISPVGHAEDVIFEPFVGELSVSGSMIAGKTYNLGKTYSSGEAKFSVDLQGGLFSNVTLSTDGGGQIFQPGPFSGQIILGINPGQSVTQYNVLVTGTPMELSTITYSISGSFRGTSVSSATPEVTSLVANPQTFERGGTVILIAVANQPTTVNFEIRDSNENIIVQGPVATVNVSGFDQAEFFWNGLINGSPAPVGGYKGRAFAEGQVAPAQEVLFLVVPKPTSKKKNSYARTGNLFYSPDNDPSNIVDKITDPMPGSCPKPDPGKNSICQSFPEGVGNITIGGVTISRVGTFPPISCWNPAIGGGPCFSVACGPTIIQDISNYPRGFSVGDPVNAVSGNFVWQEADLSLNSHQPLTQIRTYNSLDTNQTVLGRGWNSIITTRLEILDTTVTFINPDGAPIIFDKVGNELKGPPELPVTLSLATDTGFWALTHPNGAVWTFDESGKILRITPTCCGRGPSEALVFEYDNTGRLHRMLNPGNQWFEFGYDNQGKVSLVKDSSGRQISYTFDTRGNLIAMVNVLGQRTDYLYDGNGFLIRVEQPGARITQVSYSDNRAYQVIEPNGERSTRTWTTDNQKMTYTEADGTVNVYKFNQEGQVNRYEVTAPNQPTIVKEFVASGDYLTEYSNGVGGSSHFDYNDRGLIQSKTDSLGNITRYEWHPKFRHLTKKIDPLGRIWSYKWCPKGNLLRLLQFGRRIGCYVIARSGATKQSPGKKKIASLCSQ